MLRANVVIGANDDAQMPDAEQTPTRASPMSPGAPTHALTLPNTQINLPAPMSCDVIDTLAKVAADSRRYHPDHTRHDENFGEINNQLPLFEVKLDYLLAAEQVGTRLAGLDTAVKYLQHAEGR